ncbi:MAG TPA: hypothetical protein VE645_19035 [Pseudonocardiaceae bacterium]|jgi:hypothetical protein|nr:hypothetical protein [Pseudonocardiaceae bacterium]
MSNATIPRAKLVDAIEAGIARARHLAGEGSGPTDEDCAKLRRVGREAKVVATGSYTTGAGCPIVRAFRASWYGLSWDGYFIVAYDAQLRGVVPGRGEYTVVD